MIKLTTKVCSTMAEAAGRAMVEREKKMVAATTAAAVGMLQLFIVCNFVWFSLLAFDRCTSM